MLREFRKGKRIGGTFGWSLHDVTQTCLGAQYPGPSSGQQCEGVTGPGYPTCYVDFIDCHESFRYYEALQLQTEPCKV